MSKDEILDLTRWDVWEVLFRPQDPDVETGYFPIAPSRLEVLAQKDALSDKKRYWEFYMGVHLDFAKLADKARREAIEARRQMPPVLMPVSAKRGQ